MKKNRIIALVVIISLALTACGKASQNNSSNNAETKNEVTAQNAKNGSDIDKQNGNSLGESTPTPESSKQPEQTATPSPTPTPTPTLTPTPKPPEPTATPKPSASVQPQVNVKNKLVVIDPGHANRSNLETEPLAPGSSVMKIKDGGGAQGISTKTPEYLVNMEVSKRLKSLLEQRGFTVVMTKTDNSVSLGNVERAEVGNKANANLVIRIHADSSDNSTVTGASMLIPQAINDNTKAIYDESKRCGQIVLNTLVSEIGMKNRGLDPRNDMTGFNWSKVPVILVEMGFLSNPDEDKKLSSAEYQDKLAKGLADGISEALK